MTHHTQGFSYVTSFNTVLGGDKLFTTSLFGFNVPTLQNIVLWLNHTLLHLLGTTSHCQWLSHSSNDEIISD